MSIEAMTSSNGRSVLPHWSTVKNCSPVRDSSFGPKAFRSEDHIEFEYLVRPICGVAIVLKLIGSIFSKNFRD